MDVKQSEEEMRGRKGDSGDRDDGRGGGVGTRTCAGDVCVRACVLVCLYGWEGRLALFRLKKHKQKHTVRNKTLLYHLSDPWVLQSSRRIIYVCGHISFGLPCRLCDLQNTRCQVDVYQRYSALHTYPSPFLHEQKPAPHPPPPPAPPSRSRWNLGIILMCQPYAYKVRPLPFNKINE